MLKHGAGNEKMLGQLGSAFQKQITALSMNAQLRTSITKISHIHEEIQAARARQLEKIRLQEERKRAVQGLNNMLDRMEEDVTLDMQLKIEQMMSVKKQKNQKVMRNNPPKKEVLLKDSKDK